MEEGVSGDLYVVINVRPDPRFKRDGPHLWHNTDISYIDAILGGKKEVPTLEGSTMLKIPAGTQPGTVIRVRGEGVGGRGMRGDLYVRLKVRMPEKVIGKEKEMLEELRKLTDERGGKRHRFR